jgi:Tfp pilus assembly protein PilN
VAEVRADACTLLLLDARRIQVRAFRTDGLVGVRSAQALDDSATRLSQEINRTCLHFGREGYASPSRVLLAGAAGESEALAELLSCRLGLPVARFDPGAALVRPQGLSEDLREELIKFPGLLGAAVLDSRPAMPRLDLLPPALRQARVRRRRIGWGLAAASLAFAAMLPPALHYREREAGLRERIGQLDSVVAPLRSRHTENRAQLERLADLQRKVGTLQSVQDRRSTWQAFLADLEVRVGDAEEAWLESIQISPGNPPRVHVSGRMLDRTAGADVQPRINSLLARLAESPFVGGIEQERFQRPKPGLLQFDFVLVGKTDRPL